MTKLYPLKMKPIYKEILWGGQSLASLYERKLPFEKTAESWEASAHRNGCSTVEAGALSGENLVQLAKEYKEDFLGSLCDVQEGFPLLLKLIDACDFLSVQVHPDDELAKLDNDKGKTEMWIVLCAKENAGLYMGFNRDITKEEYKKRISDNTLKEVLNFVPAKAGDVFYIAAGTVHAIGAGLVIAEIQQNSDTTYRVYDWGRVGKDNKPRELHIDKALEASTLEKYSPKAQIACIMSASTKISYYPCCKYFGAVKQEIAEEYNDYTNKKSFHILFCSEGEGEIKADGNSHSIKAGETYIIPACVERYQIKGKLTVYKFFVPDFNEDYLLPLEKAGVSQAVIDSLNNI